MVVIISHSTREKSWQRNGYDSNAYFVMIEFSMVINYNNNTIYYYYYNNNILLYIIREHAVGNPSAIEGQTANILISRTGLWARCSTSLLEFEKYLTSLLAETKRCVIPATKFKFFTSIWQFFIIIIMIIIIVKLINQPTRATIPMTRTPKISLFNNERKVALHALFIFVHYNR